MFRRTWLGALLLSIWCASPAHADLWGLVDDAGQIQFADHQVDERYTLFVRGEFKKDLSLTSELKYVPPTESVTDHIIYKRVSKTPNVSKYEALIAEAAQANQLDPALVKAVIAVESAYDPGAISPKGATGLMQLMPGTATRFGVKKIADPKDNIGGGTRYLRTLLKLFNGRLDLTLAAYNAGEGAVQRYKNTIPPYAETQNYVKLVMQFYAVFNPDFANRQGVGTISKTKDGRVRVTLPGPPRSTGGGRGTPLDPQEVQRINRQIESRTRAIEANQASENK